MFSTAVMLLNILAKGIFPPALQSPINAGAFTMLAGLVIVPVVSLLTKAPEKQHVENCFAAYEQTVTVPAKRALGGYSTPSGRAVKEA